MKLKARVASGRTLSNLKEVFDYLGEANPGERMTLEVDGFGGSSVKLTAITPDPLSRTLFVTFKGPFRSEILVEKTLTIADDTVQFARLDLDGKNRPVSLEIFAY